MNVADGNARALLDPERLAKSLERLSIFDAPTRNLLLKASEKYDLQELIGTMDQDAIQAQM